MNKKVMFPVIMIVILAAVIVSLFIMKPTDKNLDLNNLSTTISTMAPFNEMATMPIDKETAITLFGLEDADVEEVIGVFPMMNVHASMYTVIKATDGKADAVLAKVEAYGSSYEQQWATYLPEQHDLVTQRKVGKVGNYVYMIVASTASDIEKLVK